MWKLLSAAEYGDYNVTRDLHMVLGRDKEFFSWLRDMERFFFFLLPFDGWLMFGGVRYMCFFDVTSNARKLL